MAESPGSKARIDLDFSGHGNSVTHLLDIREAFQIRRHGAKPDSVAEVKMRTRVYEVALHADKNRRYTPNA
jgi:hypothetical protein